MSDPFWKVFNESPRCPESYPNPGGRLGSHPKCCDGCPYPKQPCESKLDCGESCYLPKGHEPPCLCIGDMDGEPGTCPA